MPRRRQPRKIVAPPKFREYRPYGHQGESTGTVELLYEEYESIKLADYDGLSHHQACVLMGISRPTFARIYESARRKIAQALVETKKIKSVFGNVYFDRNWYKCTKCHNLFTLPDSIHERLCPMCKSNKIEFINSNQ
nr:DUF134 domain-containing protein [Bacteroidota bacterium]